jgi:ubiquinone biosynthesis protein
VERDLQVVRWLMPVIHRVFGFRNSGAVVEQLERMLRHELDYQHERENIARFQQLFAQRKDVIVPQVFDGLSSKAVLVMSFEAGMSLSDPEALRQAGLDPVALARTLVDCYMSMLFEHRLFHADPHPGNFLARGDNQLVVLDYGAVEPVSEELVQGIRTVVMGGLTRNPDLVLQGIERMGFVAEGGDKALLERVGREYLHTLGQLSVKDFAHIDSDTLLKLSGAAQLRGQLRQVTGSLRYPDSYFYVERALALLFGLVGKLAPEKGLLGIAAPLAARAVAKVKPPPAKSEPP